MSKLSTDKILIGLTGNIACGKSTVAQYLKKKGMEILDADRVAREIVLPGTPALKEIVQTFGKEYLHADGTLNRKKLGRHIFANEMERQKLDQIMAQYLQQGFQDKIDQSQASHLIFDMPLLFEQNYDQDMDAIIVVHVQESIQQERLQQRDHCSLEEAKQKMRSQMPLIEKQKQATWQIDNNGMKEETEEQCQKLLAKLKKLVKKEMHP